MTNYANFAYYTGTYKGAVIDTASFDLNSRKATLIIRQHTFNRIPENNIPDEVKMCCCELAELLYKQDIEDKGNISSEKVGDYSVSYENSTDRKNLADGKAIEIINNWLLVTGLLYRGCD
jgi:hypothetical protein